MSDEWWMMKDDSAHLDDLAHFDGDVSRRWLRHDTMMKSWWKPEVVPLTIFLVPIWAPGCHNDDDHIFFRLMDWFFLKWIYKIQVIFVALVYFSNLEQLNIPISYICKMSQMSSNRSSFLLRSLPNLSLLLANFIN